jgi:hypothetical protein
VSLTDGTERTEEADRGKTVLVRSVETLSERVDRYIVETLGCSLSVGVLTEAGLLLRPEDPRKEVMGSWCNGMVLWC